MKGLICPIFHIKNCWKDLFQIWCWWEGGYTPTLKIKAKLSLHLVTTAWGNMAECSWPSIVAAILNQINKFISLKMDLCQQQMNFTTGEVCEVSAPSFSVGYQRTLWLSRLYRVCLKGVTNFGHEFHIPKQEKMPTSTCARKYLIYDL
jgi:hypothetical protein